MLIAGPGELAGRRAALNGSPDVAALAGRLAKLAIPILDRPLYIPQQKALLSRGGGVCSGDGSRLRFDPLSPHRHTCPECDATFQGVRHDGAWVWRYHIWLSERAIHLALLGRVCGTARAADRARDIVLGYADRYRDYPNVDNVLGPTRLFFSTYLESIWLTQLLIAASLLEWDERAAGRVSAMAEESARLIASFDEGWSNRQVWNSAALIAAGRWLADDALLRSGVDGTHGIRALLRDAVSERGWWHEGENYHFFALRGFLLAAELLRPSGVDLYDEESFGPKLPNMYLAPLDTVLPDLSLPARGDSPFDVTLYQPRFAELWEMGWARTRRPRLASLLGSLYGGDVPPAADPGFAEIAEVEQNRPAQRLHRSGLGWKSLLWMDQTLPGEEPHDWQPGSVLVDGGGPAVLRASPRRLVGLECRGTGAGHGHPDQLHLTLFWDRPWLLDFGTGSYVAPSLFWYRSALAHNAPAAPGVGQHPAPAWCAAFHEVGDWAWCRGVATGLLGPDTYVERTIVAGPAYVLDVIDVRVPDDQLVELPLHPLGAFALTPDDIAEVEETRSATQPGQTDGGVDGVWRLMAAPARARCGAGDHRWDIIFAPRPDETFFVMQAPGPPTLALSDAGRSKFLVRRAVGPGRWIQVFAPESAGVTAAEDRGDSIQVARGDAAVDSISWSDGTLEVRESGGPVTRLGGAVPPPMPVEVPAPVRARIPCTLLESPPAVEALFDGLPADAVMVLGEDAYRRSEAPYPGPDALRGRVAIVAHGTELFVCVEVRKDPLCFRGPAEPDPALDNEVPDIHSDGVQCYLDWDGWRGFVAVPVDGTDQVRIRPVAGTQAQPGDLTGTWHRTPDGFALLLVGDVGAPVVLGQEFLVQVVINEMRPGRLRRAGQLALGGAPGWTYLRGDRESPMTAVIAEVR